MITSVIMGPTPQMITNSGNVQKRGDAFKVKSAKNEKSPEITVEFLLKALIFGDKPYFMHQKFVD